MTNQNFRITPSIPVEFWEEQVAKEGGEAGRRWKMAASRVNSTCEKGDIVDLVYPLYNLTYALNEFNGSNRDYHTVRHILVHEAIEQAELYGKTALINEVYNLLTTRFAIETIVNLNEAIKVKVRARVYKKHLEV